MQNSKRLLLNNLLLLLAVTASWSTPMTGGSFELTKDQVGATGSPAMASADYALAFAWGEGVAGDVSSEPTYQVVSGYYGGRFGNAQTFAIAASRVGTSGVKTFFQDHLQVGVPFDAPIQLTFSDQLDATTLPSSVHVAIAADHLGTPAAGTAAVTISPDAANQVVTIFPEAAWAGNTLYDIQVTPKLQNIDGVPLDQTYHLYYLTWLDHQQDNVVLNPLTAPGLPAATVSGPIGAMTIQIPARSLPDNSTILSSRDPLTAPLNVDPNIIQEANDKARAAGGLYRVPLAIQEIKAYDADGNLRGPLAIPAELTINYGNSPGAPAANGGLIRAQTLSLYALDETHRLWVKLPASQNATASHLMTAPVTHLSVFALMGNADASASESFVFPVPWRPHGPNAGTGAGQTGTEADGLTFSNLPSECTLKIYTIAGDLVRQIQHSDIGGLIGQEKWDAKTTHGVPVASGVYLWRVESSIDSKNGKLMIIR